MGEYNKKDNKFITNDGIVCTNIEDAYYPSADYFSAPTTISELRSIYGEEISEESLLTQYLNI